MGNPAPLGLIAFALTNFFLMTIDCEWSEKATKELVTGFGFWYAGAGQVLVGLLELLHGKTFAFTAFCTYGFLWMSLSTVWLKEREDYGAGPVFKGGFHDGESFVLAGFSLVTFLFFVVSLKANRCLQVTFFVIGVELGLLSIGVHDSAVKKVGGYVGIISSIAAMYTAFAEIINEEWGYAVLPGLASMKAPKHNNDDEMWDLTSRLIYDAQSNSLFINMSAMQFLSDAHVEKFKEGITAKFGQIGKKAHVVVNYKGVVIPGEVLPVYSAAIHELQRLHYLSVVRYSAASFGLSQEDQSLPWAAHTSAETTMPSRPSLLGAVPQPDKKAVLDC